ncbi:MAG TPA: hypothetical protein PKA64_10715 [Myxococcota bacterium]|nr:hypothetical protein [Myxococcota bacterium]
MSKDRLIRPGQGNAAAAALATQKGAPPAPGNAVKATDQLAKGKDQQQQMLQFIEGRLAAISSAQKREISAIFPQEARVWWDEVADSHKQEKGLTKPEPRHWHQAATRYREAAEAICRGDMQRGAALLRQAHQEDKKAFESLSTLTPAHEAEKPKDNPWHDRVANLPTGSLNMPHSLSVLASRVIGERDGIADPPVREEERKATKPLEKEPEAEDKAKAAEQAKVKPETIDRAAEEASKKAEDERKKVKPVLEKTDDVDLDKEKAGKGGKTG